jgi:KaiC/GvpD/RAD55 family RecA-like ATPase
VDPDLDIESPRSPRDPGLLVLVTVPNRNSFALQDRMMKNVQALFQGWKERRLRTCFVLDSICALVGERRRRAYDEVFNFARLYAGMGIFVSEALAPEDHRMMLKHLVDIVVRMDTRMRESPFTERVLEIEKCRTQSHIRGEHLFAIHSNQGIYLYPSVQARLSIWRRRVRRVVPAELESWKVDDALNFDPILRGDLARGDAVQLLGPPATHKFPIGLSFLASGLRADPASCALLISLREDEASVLRTVRNYYQFETLTEHQGDTAVLSPRLRVLHFPPDYFTAERFLHWVDQTLRGLKQEGRIARVLFSTLSQLQYNSPMFEKEKLFIAALIELFKKEEVTSLFLGVGGGPGQEIANIFDTILFTHEELGDKGKRVLVSVGHSNPGNALRTPVALEHKVKDGRASMAVKLPFERGDESSTNVRP